MGTPALVGGSCRHGTFISGLTCQTQFHQAPDSTFLRTIDTPFPHGPQKCLPLLVRIFSLSHRSDAPRVL